MKFRRALVALAIATAIVVVGYYYATWRAPLVTRPAVSPTALAILDVAVVDVVTGTVTPSRDVFVRDGLIEDIRPHGGPIAKGLATIDAAGLTMIPGLIDVHAHTESSPDPPWARGLPDVDLNLERFLYCGVTRIFDPGAQAPDVFELRAEVNDGRRLGPTIHATGPIFTAVDGHPGPMMRETMPGFIADYVLEKSTREIGSPADGKRAVDALIEHRPDMIKIAIDRIPLDAPRLSKSLATAIVAAARTHEIRTVAHIGTIEDAVDAADAGAAAWIHGVYKERIPDEAITKLAAYGIPMAPTLVVFRGYAKMGRGTFESTELERQITSPEILEARKVRPADFEVSEQSMGLLSVLVKEQEHALENVGRLAKAGVIIMAGSDAQAGVIHGAGLHRELQLLADAGLSPLQVLRAATLHPARFLAQRDDPPYGVIAVGRRADLVLVRGDPTVDVRATSRIHSVVLNGQVLERHPQ